MAQVQSGENADATKVLLSSSVTKVETDFTVEIQ